VSGVEVPPPIHIAPEPEEPTNVGSLWIAVWSLLFVTLAVVLLIATAQVWPSSGRVPGTFVTVHRLFGHGASLSLDANFLVLAAVVGALGATLHSIRSFAWYVGQRRLRWTWVLYYITLPIVGSVLALFVYWLIRGGLISTDASTKDFNPYGIAAVSGLIGLFSDQAAQMLLNVFNNIFAKVSPGKNAAPRG
jgi:hypothetical protein